ncbi:SIR2 family protein [Dysgonomonas macrotermitis]|uniref:SIR2 family protein n=1 Tax=Dysgonomonas macrotermitis TaxID=1346286 RepID=UPI00373FCE1E
MYPTPTKQNKSLGSPYVELFREFQKKLLIPHSVLFVIGYSFSDEHVNNIIYQALATNSTINLVILNDISSKDIAKINDNRIFKIWGCINNDGKDTMVHYFDYIVDNLFPNIDATKNQEMLLKKFIDYYNENLSK